MSVDVLILNTATVDFRREDFFFTDELVDEGGLAKCQTKDMPGFSQDKLSEWIRTGFATAGGPGNSAPLIARAGLKAAVAVELGAGAFDGLDAQGHFFFDTMAEAGVDVSEIWIHPSLPTGTSFIHQLSGGERGGLVYFPNANNDFDFEKAKKTVKRLMPRIVYYMYSGISDRGDANGGRDLAAFMEWCRQRCILTIFDSHTLTEDPTGQKRKQQFVEGYKLLEPVLPYADIFFTSSDEAALIGGALGLKPKHERSSEEENIIHFLDFMSKKYWTGGTKFLGVTVSDGAYEKHILDTDSYIKSKKIKSRFMAGEVIDLIGAGDAFRAGLLTYIAKNTAVFRSGKMDFEKAVQMGNLFASLYVKSDLTSRYEYFQPYENMLKVVESSCEYNSFNELIKAIN